MKIIMLRGFSCAGKDYVGNILCEEYGYSRFAIADSLKAYVANKYNCSFQQLHSQLGKSEICCNDVQGRTFRQILIDEAQTLRNTDSNVLSELCAYLIRESGYKRIVITDWRYENEYNYIQQSFPHCDVVPVQVVRKNQTTSPVDDPSEYQMNTSRCGGDYILENPANDSIYSHIDKLVDYVEYELHSYGSYYSQVC